MAELGDVDVIRRRTGLSYREAQQLLDDAGGDLVEALARYQERNPPVTERIQVRSEELVAKVKELIHQGNVTRLKLRQGDRILLDIPMTVGVIGAILAPVLAAVGVVAALVTQTTLEVERSTKTDSERDDRE